MSTAGSEPTSQADGLPAEAESSMQWIGFTGEGQRVEVVASVDDAAREPVGATDADELDQIDRSRAITPVVGGVLAERWEPLLTLLVVGEVFGHRRSYEAGMGAHGDDAGAVEFGCERLGEPGDRRLGRGEGRNVLAAVVAEVAVHRHDSPGALFEHE